MNEATASHLTEEQVDEYLVSGSASGECESHLEACAVCREEVSRFRDSVYVFNRASLAWSEAQREVSLRGRVREQQLRTFTYPLRWALACVAVLAVGLPLAQREAHHASVTGQVAHALAMQDSPAQIREDNRLMQSVDVALADTDPSPVAEYGLVVTSEANGRSRAEERVR